MLAPAARPARVLVIIHNPRLASQGGRPLTAVLGWPDPATLIDGYQADVAEVSHGQARYEIVERVAVDGFPVKADGFQYDPEEYLRCWRARSGFHEPDAVDYLRLLDEFDVLPQVNAGRIDEVWLFAGPYAGYYESRMVGPGAVWCNAPPLAHPLARRRLVVMGFNFERGVGEMLEDLGHRAEALLARRYQGARGEANLWERFTRYDLTHPGRAECGNVHFAPNSVRDYDWGNPRPVLSGCDAWLQFPDLSAPPRTVTCAEWGGGDIRAHHRWWLRRFPHGPAVNWWPTVRDANHVE